MKPQISRNLLALLTLGVLFLAARQPAAPGTTNQPDQPAKTAVPVKPTEAVSQATPTGEGSALPLAGKQVPEGWQVFNDSTQSYSLAYPAEWGFNPETKYSRVFHEIQKEPAGMGPPLRLYVSVYPQAYINQDWEVYNFIPGETIQGFMALPVGESNLKVPGSPAPDYFTYTRLPDRMVAGKTALVIENSKVWEMPAGTKDRVILFVTEGTTYMLGMYYETPEQLAMFEQVLDSFQFVP